MKVNEVVEGTRCWKGYEKKGMKTMFGKRVPNCVKKEDIDPEGPEVTIGDYTTTHFFMCGSAIKTAEKNRKSLGLKNVQFLNQDIFEYNQLKADLLLCNPPYLAKHEIDSLEQSVRDYDPLSALTDFKNGTSFYKHLISNFNKLVKKNGIMLLEIPFSAVTDDIISINKNFNANKSLFYKDLEGKNRVIKIY